MHLNYRAAALMSALLLAGCATAPTPTPAPSHPRPETGRSGANVPSSPAQPSATELEEEEARARQTVLKQDLEEETRRLLSYQKNLFQVFKLTETLAGFREKPNALGVYELKSSKNGKLRLTLAQLPDSPAHLSLGGYVINLDTVFDYVESQECATSACEGKTQNVVRSVPKTIQIYVSPKTGYVGRKDVTVSEGRNIDAQGHAYRSSYSNLVMTVRRMTVTPTGRVGD